MITRIAVQHVLVHLSTMSPVCTQGERDDVEASPSPSGHALPQGERDDVDQVYRDDFQIGHVTS